MQVKTKRRSRRGRKQLVTSQGSYGGTILALGKWERWKRRLLLLLQLRASISFSSAVAFAFFSCFLFFLSHSFLIPQGGQSSVCRLRKHTHHLNLQRFATLYKSRGKLMGLSNSSSLAGKSRPAGQGGMAAKVAHGEGRKGERSWPISKLLDPRNQVKLERGRGNVHMGDMIDKGESGRGIRGIREFGID